MAKLVGGALEQATSNDQITKVVGSAGVRLTRLRTGDLELLQPSLPEFTLSILLAGRSRPWRDLGDGYAVPKGAEGFDHLGGGILTPADTAVAWRVEGRHDCLILSLPKAAASNVLDELLPHGLRDLDRLTQRVVHDPVLPVVATELWGGKGHRLDHFEADHAIALVLARLARQSSTDGIETLSLMPREQLSPTNLRRAKEFLQSKVAEDPSLAEVAAVTGLSPYHFLRGFKAATGRTPFQWLQDLRIEMACGLLAATDMPIAQLALEVGFKTQSHFGAVFRRLTGTTPAKWRLGWRS
jgi:AraC-like DNA-binding protein